MTMQLDPSLEAHEPKRDLARVTLGVLAIAGLIVGSLWILQPFLLAAIWAITLVTATWPLMVRIQRFMGGRRGIAVVVMTMALLLMLVVPLWLAVTTVVENADDIGNLIRATLAMDVPPPPAWIEGVPVIGRRTAQMWEQASSLSVHELGPRLTPYAGDVTRWLLASVGSLGTMLLQFLITVGLAAVLYATGESAADNALRFGHRLGGERGQRAIELAGQAIRGVALGVVLTALSQSIVGGIGLASSGIPFAALLTAVIFVLCLAQIGPALVLIPAIVWLYYGGENVRGTMLVVFTVVAMTMDNVIRPFLISKGVRLPILLVLAGVIGGLIALGLLGIFIGPTLLAVTYTLLKAWIADDPPDYHGR